MNQPSGDEDPPSPEESLRLIDAQKQRSKRDNGNQILVYWLPWGLTWLISFGLFFLSYGLHGEAIVPIPLSVPIIVLFSLTAISIGITMFAGARAGRKIQGATSLQGMMYGYTWFLGFISVTAVGIHFSPRLPNDQTSLLWASTSMGLVGVLYMAGGAMWREWSMFVMGGWLTVVNAIGVVLGPGWHYLLVAVAGGGGMIVGALIIRLWPGRTRP